MDGTIVFNILGPFPTDLILGEKEIADKVVTAGMGGADDHSWPLTCTSPESNYSTDQSFEFHPGPPPPFPLLSRLHPPGVALMTGE